MKNVALIAKFASENIQNIFSRHYSVKYIISDIKLQNGSQTEFHSLRIDSENNHAEFHDI